jgi:tetratricopeptide (TPR) repeat protein
MLQTIREYAAEQLVARDEAGSTRRLHAEYYLAMAQAADPQLTGAEQKIWLDRLERDHDNLRAALEWSLEQGDVQTAAQLGVALKRFWEVHNHFGEGRRWLGEILAASDAMSPHLKAKVLNAAGALAIAQSDFDDAFSLLHSSLELQRRLGDELGVASALNNLGMAALSTGKNEMAVPLFEEGLSLLRKLGDKGRTATMLGNFAVVIGQLGDMDRAAQLLNESLTLRRELGNKWGVAAALGNLAEVLRYQGNYGRAREVYTEAIVLLNELGDKVGVAKTLEGFAAISMAEGRPERAAKMLSVVEGLLSTSGAVLGLVDQAEYTRLMDEARSALDEATLETAWMSGRVMNLDEAISYALEGW